MKAIYLWTMLLSIGCSGSPTAGGDTGGAGSLGGSKGSGGSSAAGGGADCNCLRGAYGPACGVDGTTYDATCGVACVPVAIACLHACPCPAGSTGGATGQGGSSSVSTGGTAALGATFPCGSDRCTIGQSYCSSFIGGIPGSTTTYSCTSLPASCANTTDCSCLCGTSSVHCSPNGMSSCFCSANAGALSLSCAGA